MLAGLARNAPLTRPRPGHADLAGMQKYGFDDARPVLERASARETAARVALGARGPGVPASRRSASRCVSHVVAHRRGRRARRRRCPGPDDRGRDRRGPGALPRPGDRARAMVAEIDAARKDGDTLGGVVEVVVYGLPPGLGSHVHWDRRLDARLAGALMGIQAIKGVEVGDGFEPARRRGSQAHDEIDDAARPGVRRRHRPGRRHRGRHDHRRGAAGAGRDEADLHRAAGAATVDVATGEPAVAINQRSDVCAVPAAGVVAEAMVALVLAEPSLEKFGGDSVAETRRNARRATSTRWCRDRSR